MLLNDLEYADEFVGRHIGSSTTDISEMLDYIGLASLDAMIDKGVPGPIRSDQPLTDPSVTEANLLAEIADLASKNSVFKSYIGMGYYDTHIPSVILRNVLENPGWYTAYTPYQAEISQGRMEALLNFQQMIVDLTAMELSNASMLDEATAAAEAMTLMKRISKAKSETIFVAENCHPQTIAIIETRATPMGYTVQVGNPSTDLNPDDLFGVILQYPATDGTVTDYKALVDRIHESKALVCVCADLLSLVLLTPPGEWGADVVVGSAQRFGVPMGYGGPHAGYMATREAFKRAIPGRLIGVSIDAQGNQAMRLALQTREQHIRREKATSNICTAQVLLANIAGFYATYHGPKGLKTIAQRTHRLTTILAAGLQKLGVVVETECFFDTITLNVGTDASTVHDRAQKAGMNLRVMENGQVGISCDETTSRNDIQGLWQVISGKANTGLDVGALDAEIGDVIPENLSRTSDFLTHDVFNRYHSETGMMRYLRALEDKDLALNRAMIPLGSCTMKLNAATEMIPVTWKEFGGIHPFAPLDQVEGTLELIKQLEEMLVEITGYHAVSLQPNAGSQGEFAGLLCIRKYHQSRGDDHRDICIIPASAHGTNPASAAMAGMKVVVVECDSDGNIDIDDLKTKTEKHAENLAALMITYPSTHGVFEQTIHEICDVIHDNGGQVYVDGANLQAMVGICKPGQFGGDVSHLNLHKTFCIPHGGGGPGVGPIGVGEHLAPFLPNHPVVPEAGPTDGIGPISAAPWGSASILPISWSYIRMMGGAGLTKASQVAILNANYLAKRLRGHFKVLYTGQGGLVAHECILDTRPLKDDAGITVDDIAKRLMDYGFHAPTMSWPVVGTLMVEPTESETKEELDRFADAMIAIAGEAKRVQSGEWPADDNPLINAPHTASVISADEWTHPYSREVAAYPVSSLRKAKYWSPVGRVDNVYGDRHLMCTCPSIDDYREAAE
ncbi:MAG: aminomethyl-transferring glycine dehydrogenase [Rhodospirillales bacterium]